MTSVQPLTSDLLRNQPQEALRLFRDILRTGNLEWWCATVPETLDVTGLMDEGGNSLMHLAMGEGRDDFRMARALVEHSWRNGSDVRSLISRPDHAGETPRSRALRLGLAHTARVLEAEGAVLTQHYHQARDLAGTVVLVARDGMLTDATLDHVPNKAGWARPAITRLRRDLAEIALHLPELAESYVARNGYYAITQGYSSDFERHVRKIKDEPETTTTIAHATIWAEDDINHLVTVYNAEKYTHNSNNANSAAHELTHIADTETTVVQSHRPFLRFGKHSEKPVFRLLCELDSILEGKNGIVGGNRELFAGVEGYAAYPELEYFARASHHLGCARPALRSPLFAAYQKLVLRPALAMERDGEVARLAYLDNTLSSAQPETALGPSVLKLLTSYRADTRPPPHISPAERLLRPEDEQRKSVLQACKGAIHDAMGNYMNRLVADADRLFARRALLPSLIGGVRPGAMHYSCEQRGAVSPQPALRIGPS